jgi:hypothetical protein
MAEAGTMAQQEILERLGPPASQHIVWVAPEGGGPVFVGK